MKLRATLILATALSTTSVCFAEMSPDGATKAADSNSVSQQNGGESTGSGLTGTPPTGGSLFRMFGGLLFCLGVFGAGIHISRKYGFAQPRGTKRRMKVIEKMQLTQKSSLMLVACDGREMLLTVGPEQARILQSQMSSPREYFEESFADMYSVPAAEEKKCVA